MKKLLIGLVTLLAALAATLYFSPAALMATARFVECQLAGLSAHSTTVGDLDIAYYEGGPASGETLVMVHGFGANKDNWLRMARHFTDRYRVIDLAKCPACRGKAVIKGVFHELACAQCNASGWVTAETGEVLPLDVLVKQLSIRLQAAE
eukprot:gene20061-24584_t